MSVLRVANLGRTFGGLVAVAGIDFSVQSGQIFGLIGPNGSGKTTTINVLTNVIGASSGEVALDGRRLTGLRQNEIARAGVTRTFQNLRLLASQTVLDNVRVGQTIHCRTFASRCNPFPFGQERALRGEAEALLERFDLAGRRDSLAGSLSYGEKKRLEIARALAMKPRFLLLDEPAAGMNGVEVNWLTSALRRRHRDPAGGAPHEAGHERVRPCRRPPLRPQDRRRRARSGRPRSEGDRVLPGKGALTCWR
jgi:branched-chain amino acid transport system ATP-binding protein